jgi:hypothetical protein
LIKPSQDQINEAYNDSCVKIVRQFFENVATGMDIQRAKADMENGLCKAGVAKGFLEELPE